RRARLPVPRRAPLPRSGNRPRAARGRGCRARGFPVPVRRGPRTPRATPCGGRHPPRGARARRTARRAAARGVRRGPRARGRRAMNLVLLLPAGLVALGALLVPVLIHLVRRMELRRTDFAALRWLGERARPRRRVRVERPWLL